MKSLFIKIFLWFWLATALIIAALTLAIGITDTGLVEAPQLIDGTMKFHTRQAQKKYENEGLKGLNDYIAEITVDSQIKATLLDENGNEIVSDNIQKFPDEIKIIALDDKNLNRTLLSFPSSGFVVLRISEITGGKKLAFYTLQVKPSFNGSKFAFTSYALRVLFVLLTAGILCYLLARYIASPISKIRNATQQLADGDLTVRVSPIIGRRSDELAGMAKDFDQMAEKIESLMTAQWRLLRDISHELRSPLARLNIGLALARRHADEKTNKELDRIGQESAQLNEMVDRLLELDRWEFGTEKLPRQEIILSELVSEIALDADFEARSQNRRVIVSKLVPCNVEGVPSLIRSAIENVVRNALRQTDEKTNVEISLRNEGRDSDKKALITVRDYGDGVPEESINEIFKPFYRVDDARDRDNGGTGLGLAITERAIRLHQGSIIAKNATDRGFIVEIRLPAIVHSV